jgi:transcriptional regulator with XRE-family HTH domain
MRLDGTRLGKEISAARSAKGLSQTGLAQSVKVTRASISNIERGKQALSLDLFCRISIALNIPPPLLLDKTLNPDPINDLLRIKDARIREMIEKAID